MSARPGAAMPDDPPQEAQRTGIASTFAIRNFRLLWIGLLVSNLGTWMQLTALGYLVVRGAAGEGDAAFHLGLIGVSQALPALFLSPLAGVVADTFGRRTILLMTNSAVAFIALVLAIMVSMHQTPFAALMLMSALSAAARAFDAPARQSWVPLLVGRAHLSNAIGLNSLAFNAPSAIGPSIAGYLIASVSIAGSFYVNAACTLAVIAALLLMETPLVALPKQTNFIDAFREGLRYLGEHPTLRLIVLGLIVNSLLVRPYLQLLPAYAVHVLLLGPSGLGLLLGFSGVGAVAGALTTALMGNVEKRSRLWAAAGIAVGCCVTALGLLNLVPFVCIALAGAGFFTLLFVGSSNILIQTLAPDAMRGRAVSAFSMIILGVVPLGTLVIGSLSSAIGLRASFSLCGLAAMLFTGSLWMSQQALRDA